MASPPESAGASDSDHEADRWLVSKIRGGDVHAYEVLVRRHRDRIYRIALRMLGNPHDADDVAQEVAIQLWTAIAGFAGRAEFTTWLYRVVINRCVNHQRRSLPTRSVAETDAPVVAGADESVIAAQRARATMGAVAELPEEQRAALVLHQLEGLSYREVARVLKVSEAVVRGRLARARRALLVQLREWT